MTTDLHLITFGASAAITIAQANGLFAAEGLAVQHTVTPSSTEQMRGLGEERYDIASTAFDNVLAWSGREGANIVAVAQGGSGNFLPVYVRPEISDWTDLRGKRLSVDAVDTAFALVLRRILLEHGLDMDRGDYELVPDGATKARFESMERGETFAAILNRPWDGRGEQAGFKKFGDHRQVLPNYPGTAYAVNTTWAAKHSDDLVGFLRALFGAAAWMNDTAHRDEAVTILTNEGTASSEAALADIHRTSVDGAFDLESLAVPLELRVRFSLTPPKGGDLSVYVDASYLERALG
jgi:ABC-type nitrate/sulfonate/bicarbonate transport system substrate-binding protein